MKKLILLLSIFFSLQLSAQDTIPPIADTTRLLQIITNDGNEYVGTMLDQTLTRIRLETASLGVISIRKQDIKSMEEVPRDHLVRGELWAENLQAARYFWAPNGYGLKAGEGYYQNLWIFFNQVCVGVTDNFSMGLGLVPLFLLGGGPTPVWITPKISIPVKENKFNLGGGALIGTILGEDIDGFFGIAYGVTTFGSREQNLNIGLGYGFAGGEWANSPTINISGMVRLGKKGYLLTENYYIGTGGSSIVILSAGGRTIWNKFALDYGGFAPISTDSGLIVIPWLGVTVSF